MCSAKVVFHADSNKKCNVKTIFDFLWRHLKMLFWAREVAEKCFYYIVNSYCEQNIYWICIADQTNVRPDSSEVLWLVNDWELLFNFNYKWREGGWSTKPSLRADSWIFYLAEKIHFMITTYLWNKDFTTNLNWGYAYPIRKPLRFRNKALPVLLILTITIVMRSRY